MDWSSKELVLNKIQENASNLRFVSKELLKDPEVVLAALKLDRDVAKFANPDIWKNQLFVLQALHLSVEKFYLLLPEDFQKDKNLLLDAIYGKTVYDCSLRYYGKVGELYKLLPKELQLDSEISQALVSCCYEWDELLVDKDLLKDKEFILGVIEFDERVFDKIPYEHKNDPKFVIRCCEKRESLFDKVNNSFWSDREFALKAVQIKGYHLYKLPLKFLKDKELVLEAAKKDPNVSQSAHPSLWEDGDFVLKLAESNAIFFNFLPQKFQKDKEFIKECVKRSNGYVYCALSDELKNDKELALLSISLNYNYIQYSPLELKMDEEFMLKALLLSSMTFYFAPESIKKNKKIFKKYFEKSNEIPQYIHKNLWIDKDFVLHAIYTNPSSTYQLLNDFNSPLKNDQDILLILYLKDKDTFEKRCSEEIRGNENLMSFFKSKEGSDPKDELQKMLLVIKDEKDKFISSIKKKHFLTFHSNENFYLHLDQTKGIYEFKVGKNVLVGSDTSDSMWDEYVEKNGQGVYEIDYEDLRITFDKKKTFEWDEVVSTYFETTLFQEELLLKYDKDYDKEKLEQLTKDEKEEKEKIEKIEKDDRERNENERIQKEKFERNAFKYDEKVVSIRQFFEKHWFEEYVNSEGTISLQNLNVSLNFARVEIEMSLNDRKGDMWDVDFKKSISYDLSTNVWSKCPTIYLDRWNEWIKNDPLWN